MKFLIVNHLRTREAAQILSEICIPTLRKRGYAVMYLPPGKDGFEFIPINFRNLEVELASMLRERGYDKRLLLAKDRNSYDKLLSKLGRKVCGITMLEEFVDYVIASKRKKRKDMIRLIEDIDYRLALYSKKDCVILWADYITGTSSRTYLWKRIKNYGEIIR